jgi:hypothetical protein
MINDQDLKTQIAEAKSSLPDGDKADQDKIDAVRLARAYAKFHADQDDNPDNKKLKAIRNGAQQQIIGASRVLCADYLQGLNSYDRNANIFLGDMTTLLAGLGAIFTKAATVRPLSGAAGIFSGLRSEFNSDTFAQKGIYVISGAINAKREKIKTVIAAKSDLNLVSYPIEEAITDAYEFHTSCSLVAGLEEAARSVNLDLSLSTEQMKTEVNKINELRDLVNKSRGQQNSGS